MTKSREKKTVKSLRHAEYYDMQKVFDELYAKSKEREEFTDLMDIILSRENILLAYRNIKRNTGRKTAGTDKLTMEDIERLTPDEVVETVRNKINDRQGYRPKPVRRKEIPKPNGETRPLGIPCIWDRLIQQCIKQVLEPICEARFSKHSYGFRPGRSAEHAIAEVCRNLNVVKLHFCVEIDIKGFFDNVNHSKLIKQLWALGIHDKHLIYLIRQILKAPIKMPNGKLIHPDKGTPQGGIISPLLANVVLNELDWWVVSNWEESPVLYKYSTGINRNGSIRKSNGFRAMKKTRLKEMYIVRYADDFRIFCRTRSQADRTLIAVEKWLKKRLKLTVSKDKTRVVNCKRKNMEFLGFKIKVKPKATKLVTESHICDKRIRQIKKSLREQIKRIARPKDDKDAYNQVRKYNQIVEGVHNYFKYATHISVDLSRPNWDMRIVLKNRLGERLTKEGKPLSQHEKDKYGKSKMLRYDATSGCPIYPIGYIRTKDAIAVKRGLTPYTEEGRKFMYNELRINTKLMHELMLSPCTRSIEYADNKVSLFSAQRGKCAVTGRPFQTVSEIHCHHKVPAFLGGGDNYQNLVLVDESAHRLIHATRKDTIKKYLDELKLNKEQIEKVNKLRKKAKRKPINL